VTEPNQTYYPKRWISVLLFVYFLIPLAAWGAVDTNSLIIAQLIRQISIGAFLFIAALIFVKTKSVSKQLVFGIIIFSVIIIYGLLRASGHSGARFVIDNFSTDLPLLFGGLFVFSYAIRGYDNTMFVQIILLYVIGWTVFLLVSGRLDILPLPSFDFDFRALGSRAAYSQGVSKFYGMAAILAIVAWAYRIRAAPSSGLIALSFMCLALSFIGGGRGDSAAAAVLVLAVIGLRSRSILALSTVGVAVGFSTLAPVLNQLVIVQRFTAIGESGLGPRGLLYQDAIDLIASRGDCALLGCGFGSFREFYGYSEGLYVHNILLESVIVFGIPLSALFIYYTAIGLYNSRFWRSASAANLAIISFYYLMIAMKSGTILGFWFLVSYLVIIMFVPSRYMRGQRQNRSLNSSGVNNLK